MIKVTVVEIVNIISTNKNIKLIKKVRRHDHHFSTRLPYGNKKIREIYYSIVDTTCLSSKGMIIKIQSLTGKTKLKIYKNLSIYYDEMNIRRQNENFQFEEDPSRKNAQGLSKIYHEIILLVKFLQTKPQVRKMNINCYDLFYTVIEKIDDMKI